MSSRFNKHIKDHVERHEYDVDPQEIWEGILAKEKPKSRRYFWMLLFPFGIGLLAITTWLSHENLTPSTTFSNSNDTNQVELSVQDKVLSNYNKIVTLEREPKTTEIITEISSEQPASKQPPNSSIARQEKISSYFSSSKKSNLNSHSVLDHSTIEKSELSTNTIKPTQHQISSISKETKSPSRLAEKPLLAELEQVKELIALQNIINLPPGLSYKRTAPVSHSRPYLVQDQSQISVASSKQNRWSLGINAGYGFVGKSIVSSSNESEAFDRSTTETPVELFSSELLVTYDISNNWSISSGINYQRVYEKFEWSGTFFEDHNGAIFQDVENFTSIAFEKVEQTTSIYNQYNYVDIPLYLTYSPRLYRKLRPALFAGLSANVINYNEGTILNQVSLPLSLSDTKNLQVGLKYVVGAAIEFPITEYLGLQLRGLYSLRNNSQRDLSLRYDYQEINLGITYKFH